MRRPLRARALGACALSLLACTVRADHTGRLETLLLAGDRGYDSGPLLEQWGEVRYRDPADGLEAGAAVALRFDDEGSEAQVDRLFLDWRRPGAPWQLKLGRFAQARPEVGYHRLDGLAAHYRHDDMNLELYGGEPARVDGFRHSEGDALVGARARRTGLLPKWSASHVALGLERVLEGTPAWRGNWGVFASRDSLRFAAAGTHALGEDSGGDQLSGSLRLEPSPATGLELGYRHYLPDGAAVDLRERFYRVFSDQPYREWSGRLGHRFPERTLEGALSLRRISREQADDAAVLALDAAWKVGDIVVELRLDSLFAGDEHGQGAAASVERPLSPTWLVSGTAALRRQTTLLAADTVSHGIEVRSRWMLASDRYLTAAVEYGGDDAFGGGYRLSVRLVRTFGRGGPRE